MRGGAHGRHAARSEGGESSWGLGWEVGDGVAFLKQSGTTQQSSASLVEGNPPTVYDSFSG